MAAADMRVTPAGAGTKSGNSWANAMDLEAFETDASDEEKDLRRALGELFNDETALQTKIEQLVNIGVEGEVAHLCRFIQQSLRGLYGRHRETYRGRIPPEAEKHLPPEQLAHIRRSPV